MVPMEPIYLLAGLKNTTAQAWRHTLGNYACLNLNKFTTDLEGRESTRMPNRMFVTVDYPGDGSDQPDFKSATKSIELLWYALRKTTKNSSSLPG